jgi:hypothetical protein
MASPTPTGPSEEVVLTSDVQKREEKKKLKRLEVSKRKVPEPEQSHAKSLLLHVQASPFPFTLHIQPIPPPLADNPLPAPPSPRCETPLDVWPSFVGTKGYSSLKTVH